MAESASSNQLEPHERLAFEPNVGKAARALSKLKAGGGKLFILTGAGMSVQSGVPVFRMSDGSMSPDFLKFLGDFNLARRKAGLAEADDWFSFSVPEMFEKATEKEAWAYWRWRILRADVEPSQDYVQLMRIANWFGKGNYFITTSNCDQLHVKAGAPAESLYEIHGTVSKVQCANQCCDDLWPVDARFKERLARETEWVPRCPHCDYALRPNVMIFGDNKLVFTGLDEQESNESSFVRKCHCVVPPDNVGGSGEGEGEGTDDCGRGFESAASADGAVSATQDWAVLEIGAGTVVPSIRMMAQAAGNKSDCFIRVNPSAEECLDVGRRNTRITLANYFPLNCKSEKALAALSDALKLPK